MDDPLSVMALGRSLGGVAIDGMHFVPVDKGEEQGRGVASVITRPARRSEQLTAGNWFKMSSE